MGSFEVLNLLVVLSPFFCICIHMSVYVCVCFQFFLSSENMFGISSSYWALNEILIY